MAQWVIIVSGGVAFALVVTVDRILKAVERIDKNLAGLRHQAQLSGERLDGISAKVHAIEHAVAAIVEPQLDERRWQDRYGSD